MLLLKGENIWQELIEIRWEARDIPYQYHHSYLPEKCQNTVCSPSIHQRGTMQRPVWEIGAMLVLKP